MSSRINTTNTEGGENKYLFFFFKQKTAYEIKECDWSSDVCSSDLGGLVSPDVHQALGRVHKLRDLVHFRTLGGLVHQDRKSVV